MRSSRTPALALCVLLPTLLVGASTDVCSPPICPLQCEFGLKQDSSGREYCECRDGEACVAVVPPPTLNPLTNECVIFPTVCNVPDGWEPCGPGCVVDGTFVREGDTVPAPDGCNTCTCLPGGTLACTEIACPVCVFNGTIHRVGETFPAGDGCNVCTCLGGGRVVCTLRACPICPPSEATLCVETGGVWDPTSCGHYRCGAFPECDAVIPGCNCGPERNFRAGVGCVDDPACGRCAADSDCPPGSTCNTCPPDPSCPLCTVCGPPVCEPISCGFDEDCPPRSHCEGSSVCPPKVVCIWEGEPGICVPDKPCCDPARQPGAGENPFCFEGASCCADGQWACNAADGSPTCAPGRVCQ